MIIKIDIDDNLDVKESVSLIQPLVIANQANRSWFGIDSGSGIQAKVTHVSKAGNIFIHVSKSGERSVA